MNGKQARLLLDGALAFTQHIPLNSKEHERLNKAYFTFIETINKANETEYKTHFEEYEHPEYWPAYKGASQ